MKKAIAIALMMVLCSPALAGIVAVGDADFNNPISLVTADGTQNWTNWAEVVKGGGPASIRCSQRGGGSQYEGAYAAEIRYQDSALEQTLTEVIGTDAYTLSVWADCRDQGYTSYVGIALYADNGGSKTEIDFIEVALSNPADPDGNDYELLTLEADAAELAPYIGQNLGIWLYANSPGEPSLFDLVSVEKAGGAGGAIPEPAGLGLVGLALLAVRRRRS